MAESKTEKVDITVRKSPRKGSPKKASSGAKTSASGSKQAAASQNTKNTGTAASTQKQKARASQTTGNKEISRVTTASTESRVPDEQSTAAAETFGSPSVRERKGHEATLQPLNTEHTGPEAQTSDKTPQQTDKKNRGTQSQQSQPETESHNTAGGNQPAAHTVQDAALDTPETGEASDDQFTDFYSSKLDVNKASEDRRNPSHTSKHALISPRFWFIFLIFLITLIAGFIMLYQLEQAQPGAGIIFDYFQ